jgi:chromosome segregation ATPase
MENKENVQIKSYIMLASLILLLNIIILIITLVIINGSGTNQLKNFQEFITQEQPTWVDTEKKKLTDLDHALSELKEKIAKLSYPNYNNSIADLNNINQAFWGFIDESQSNVQAEQSKKTNQFSKQIQDLQKQLEDVQKKLQKWQEPLENAKKQIALYSYTLEPIEKELSKLEQPRPKGSKSLTYQEKANIKSRREQLNKWKTQLQRDKEAIEYLYNKMSNCPDEINNKLSEQKENLETLLKEIDSYKNTQEKKVK